MLVTVINVTIVVAFIFTIAAAAMLLSYIVLRLTLTRNIKKAASRDPNDWYDNDHYLGFMNTAFLAWACAAPFVKTWKNYDRYMPTNIDVRANAKPIEIAFSYLLTGSVLILAVCALVYYITDFFGWIEWEV